LETPSVSELAENFSRTHGAFTKELSAIAGLVFLSEFFGFKPSVAVEA